MTLKLLRIFGRLRLQKHKLSESHCHSLLVGRTRYPTLLLVINTFFSVFGWCSRRQIHFSQLYEVPYAPVAGWKHTKAPNAAVRLVVLSLWRPM